MSGRGSKRLNILLMSFTMTFIPQSGATAESEPRCSNWAARLESTEGKVLWRSAPQENWQTAAREDVFCPGDLLSIVGGRAAIRLSNETLVRLNTHSIIRLQPPKQSFWLELIEGAALFLSRTPKAFTVKTPYLNAAVDGTEFLTATAANQSQVAVFEGQVTAHNSAGTVIVQAGQQATSVGSQAPSQTTEITLTDAAAWGLHYPPVIINTNTPSTVETAIKQGRFGKALELIISAGRDTLTPGLAALGAGLALEQGKVDLAQSLIEQALRDQPQHTESRALAILLTLVQDDAAHAHRQAQALVHENSKNPTSLLVLSYTAQSQTQLSDALHAAEQALALTPNNELLNTRTAELMLSLGYNRRAQKRINQTLAAGSTSAKTHALAGFIELSNYATEIALRHFKHAIDADQTDALAFLGLGLSHIQKGELEQGRQFLELAVLMDPNNSLLRSYLGKSYYEEHRYSLADSQYQLAKLFDPNDPTPWFYEAHLKQANNQFPKALQLVETAITKNNNRAVYRSRMMLDSDAAARSADQSRIYQKLGFETLATQVAAKAITQAPADYDGHRALATALATAPRYQQAKASEALQATILQPLGARTLGPNYSENRLRLFPSAGPSRPGLNEYNALFAKKGLQGHASALAGTDSTRAYDWQAHLLATRTALTIGQYRHNDQPELAQNTGDYEVTEALLQFQPMTQLQLQAQIAQRDDSKDQHGEDDFLSDDAQSRDQSIRARFAPSQGHTLLVDLAKRTVDYLTEFTASWPDGTTVKRASNIDAAHLKTELSYILSADTSWTKLGTIRYQSETIVTDETLFEPDFFGFNGTDLSLSTDAFRKYTIEHHRGVYNEDFYVTLGLSRLSGTERAIKKDWTSSVGLQWQLGDRLSLHSAYWQDRVQPNLAYLESTTLSVFQKRDDNVLWAYTETSAFNIHYSGSQVRAAVELLTRNVTYPAKIRISDQRFVRRFDERSAEAYINWSGGGNLAVSLAFMWEQGSNRSQGGIDAGNAPNELRTSRIPLTLSYFPNASWHFRADLSYLSQATVFMEREVQRYRFTNLDLTSTWRAEKRPLSISLSLLNVLEDNTHFLSGGISTYGESYEGEFNEFTTELTAIMRMTVNL